MSENANKEEASAGFANVDLQRLARQGVPEVGYGAAFNGLSALLSMLNSCSAGVSVVNIDNGFGAGFLASRINHMGQVK